MPAPLQVHNLRTNARELNLEAGQKVYHLPDWYNLSHPERLTVIRQIAMQRGRDPRIARLVTNILKKGNVKPRDYVGQARVLLAWVQNPKNVYYVNEPGERLQDPVYTIKAGHGDCDDMILLLASFYESIGLPWKLVLSGRDKGTNKKIRYIEGNKVPDNCSWVHIYGLVGDRPFNPTKWYFVEPTVQNVPLGWDVIDGDASYLPEMAKKKHLGPAQIVKLKRVRKGSVRPAPLPPKQNRSPVYDYAAFGSLQGYGTSDVSALRTSSQPSAIASAVGASIAESVNQPESSKKAIDWRELSVAIVTGVLVSVGTTLLLDLVQGKGMWEQKGPLFTRLHKGVTSLHNISMFSLPQPGKGE